MSMLKDAMVYTVLAAKDVERLKTFFKEKLGLMPADEKMGMIYYDINGSKLFLYQSDFAGTNKATAMTFDVPDLEATVTDLKNKGVMFEHYEMPGMKVMGDIHVMDDTNFKSAWFKDTEGNIININQS